MKRRSIYDWKVAFFFICVLLPVTPVYLLSSAGRGTIPLVSLVAGLLVAAVVSERLNSLFFHHVLAVYGGMLWSSRRNVLGHARESLLAVLSTGLSVAAVIVAGNLAAIICLFLAGAAFLSLLYSVFISSSILCLYPTALQYGAFLYAYEDLSSFDIRDNVLDLDVGNAIVHCRINEGYEMAARLRSIMEERCGA